jgi:hypothetical protein
MDGMANAITRPAVPNAEPPARASQKQMLVGVQMIVLDKVVIDVLRSEPNLNTLDTHGLQFEHHERAEHVLQQRLIYGQRDLFAERQSPRDQMRTDKLLRQILGHGRLPYRRATNNFGFILFRSLLGTSLTTSRRSSPRHSC